MEARGPVTVVIGQFEDLVARGLQALIADDPNIEVVRAGVSHERVPATIAAGFALLMKRQGMGKRFALVKGDKNLNAPRTHTTPSRS